MRLHRIAVALLSGAMLVPVPTSAQLTYQLGSTTLLIDEVMDSSRVNIPWEILWGPDDRLWMTDGPLITRWDPVTDAIDTLIDRGHGNGMGMALHPDFPATPWVYAVFDTCAYYASCSWSEVLRFTYDPLNDVLSDETTLTGYFHPGEHSGGRVLFDTTGCVIVTAPEFYPDPNSLGGPTLRMNPDGTAPLDNPWGDLRWTRGHRNPQGLELLPNGALITTELQAGGSEINLLHAGRNYGWIEYDGVNCLNGDSCSSADYIHEPPICRFWPSVSGCGFYPHAQIPEFTNKLITCGLWSQGLVVVSFNGDYSDATDSVHWNGGAFTQLVRNRDIAIRPDGSFYLITNDRQNARIRWVRADGSTALHGAPVPPDALRAWPNPAQDKLFVDAPGAEPIRVVDAQGRSVACAAQRMGDRFILDVSALRAGVYTAHSSDAHAVRFIKR